MAQLLKTNAFNWDDLDQKLLFLGIVMTVCDVSGQCKPFYTAKKITEGLYREFYNQVGRFEKKTPSAFNESVELIIIIIISMNFRVTSKSN